MTVWQKAALAAASLFEGPRKIGPPPAPNPAARPLPDPLRGSGRGVRTVLPFSTGPTRQTTPAPVPARLQRAAAPAAAPAAPGHVYVEPRERRERAERRRADRRVVAHGSPYGTERRSGRDDRQGDRRGTTSSTAGIGLTRDYFSQVAERVTTAETGLDAGELIRFDD